MIKDNGGPSFPQDSDQYGPQGITLRDYFAGHSLAGFCAGHDMKIKHMATIAYELADAMIAERNK